MPGAENVLSMQVAECSPHTLNTHFYKLSDVTLAVHVFDLHAKTPLTADKAIATMAMMDEDGKDRKDLTALKILQLPNAAFRTSWNMLHFESSLAEDLLHCAERMMTLMAKENIDTSFFNWNRVMLLHGPPGSGKTTLCQAISQKLAIRLGEKYSTAYLAEVNANSLHSRWFGESGKIVKKTFDQIAHLANDQDALVCVLIDEVESLAGCREKSVTNDVSDALRATNQLLTALDSIRTRRNVVIFCTSNMLSSVDKAFLSRTDLKIFVKSPAGAAAYEILRSCLNGMLRSGMIAVPESALWQESPTGLVGLSLSRMLEEQEHRANYFPNFDTANLRRRTELDSPGTKLIELADSCENFSGRSLRRLPILALARYTYHDPVPVEEALAALRRAIRDGANGW